MDPIYFELALALAIVIASVVISKIAYTLLKRYVSKLTKLTETTLDDDLLKVAQRPIYIIIVLLGIFGGLSLFGPAGFIIGPMLLMIIAAFFKEYGKDKIFKS